MKLIPMTCPTCGAHLELDGDRQQMFCAYCGSKLFIEKAEPELKADNQKRTIDLERQKYEDFHKDYEIWRESRQKYFKYALIGFVIAIIIAAIVKEPAIAFYYAIFLLVSLGVWRGKNPSKRLKNIKPPEEIDPVKIEEKRLEAEKKKALNNLYVERNKYSVNSQEWKKITKEIKRMERDW